MSLLHGHLKQVLRRLGRAPLFGAIILVTVAIGEIGIRMALGAQRTALTRMYVREGLILTGMGVLCGISVAFATMRLMSSLLYHVSPMDPWTYVAATLSIIAIAWIATYLPSRRAAIVDPVHALRAE